MRSARDTFLHYLGDNLPGLPVNFIRKDATNPNSTKLKINAVNVSFFNDLLSPHVSRLQTSIDVLFSDELQAVDATQQVASLLQAAAFTANLDYTVPSAPVATGTNIYWNPLHHRLQNGGQRFVLPLQLHTRYLPPQPINQGSDTQVPRCGVTDVNRSKEHHGNYRKQEHDSGSHHLWPHWKPVHQVHPCAPRVCQGG
jgi:hypothetical protein